MKKDHNLKDISDILRRERGIAKAIGSTPMFMVKNLTSSVSSRVKILVKAEWLNPGGSVKDRPALWIVANAVHEGKLTKDKVLLDATSGNMGVGYAMICASLGYRVKLVMPGNVSEEKVRLLRAYGAMLEITDPLEGIDGAIRRAREIAESDPDSYYYADQYSNLLNPLAHYNTTGPEIIDQTSGKVTHLVVGVGTSGTMMGAGRRIKEFNRNIKVIEVQPDSEFHGIEGLKHMESAIVPSIYDPGFSDELVRVSTEEAQDMAKKLASKEGMLVGTSSGAAMVAALKIANELKEGVIVVVFPDSGIRYLSEQYWKQNHEDT